MSRFHFCRTFGNVTGVAPGRFLSAVRIYHAKRMLVNTQLKVVDIAYAVGYNSLGSFSNRFTDSVGVAPGRFRSLAREGGLELLRVPRQPSPSDSEITGTITFPRGCAGTRAYVGVFDTPIVQRRPVAATVVEAPAASEPVPFRLTGVRPGDWFLSAVAVADNPDPEPWTRRLLLVGGPLKVHAISGVTTRAQIELRLRRPTDLPILLALPELEPALEPLASPVNA